jgi:hypothetical protein
MLVQFGGCPFSYIHRSLLVRPVKYIVPFLVAKPWSIKETISLRVISLWTARERTSVSWMHNPCSGHEDSSQIWGPASDWTVINLNNLWHMKIQIKNQDFLLGIQRFERLEMQSEKRYSRNILHIFLDEEICFECEQCWTMIIAGKPGVQAQFLSYICKWRIFVYKDKVLNINTTGYSKGAF